MGNRSTIVISNETTSINSLALCGCVPTCFLGATATATCATTAGNSLALCGCIPTCFLGATATANNSTCFNGQLANTYARTLDSGTADLNTVLGSGMYRLNAGQANLPTGTEYGQMIVAHGAGDTVGQIAMDYNSGNIFWRSATPTELGGGGIWGAWRCFIHSGNIASQTVTCAGSATSANNSTCLNGQLASFYQVASTAINTGNIASQTVATAGNSACLGGQLPNFYQVASTAINTGNIASQTVACAGNATTANGQCFCWANQSNTPTYVWGTCSNGANWLAATSQLTVLCAGSATSAGSAGTANLSYCLYGCYISGGLENPTYFSPSIVKAQMLQIPDWSWSDTLWLGTYAGGDVPNVNQLVFSKNYSKGGWRSQNFASTTWGPINEFITSTNIGSQTVNCVSTPSGTYKHLGAWGVGRTDAGAILVNTAYYADTAGYSPNSTKLYSIDSQYSYGGAAPYYGYLTYDGGSMWCFKVSPATPAAVRVAYADNANYATSATYLNGYNSATCVHSPVVRASSCMYSPDFQIESDVRCKENIKSLEFNLLDIEYKEFNFISEPGRKRYGVIAQELQKVQPEMVNSNEDGVLSVSYIDLLVKEVSYLKQRVCELERRLV